MSECLVSDVISVRTDKLNSDSHIDFHARLVVPYELSLVFQQRDWSMYIFIPLYLNHLLSHRQLYIANGNNFISSNYF